MFQTQRADIQELVNPIEIKSVLSHQREAFQQIAGEPRRVIEEYVQRELNDHTEAFVESDPLQTILNDITPEKRSTERGKKALQMGALVYILLQENKPVSTKYDAVFRRENAFVQVVDRGTQRASTDQNFFTCEVMNEKVSIQHRENGQVAQVNSNRRFRVSAPDRNGTVHFTSIRTFPYVISNN